MCGAHRSFSPVVVLTTVVGLAWAGYAAWVWVGRPSAPDLFFGTATPLLAIATVLALFGVTALWIRGQSIRRLY